MWRCKFAVNEFSEHALHFVILRSKRLLLSSWTQKNLNRSLKELSIYVQARGIRLKLIKLYWIERLGFHRLMLFLAAAISRPKELCVAASWTVFKLRIDRRYRCPLRNGHTVFTGGNNKSRWRHRPPFGASLSDTLDRTGGNLCFFFDYSAVMKPSKNFRFPFVAQESVSAGRLSLYCTPKYCLLLFRLRGWIFLLTFKTTGWTISWSLQPST